MIQTLQMEGEAIMNHLIKHRPEVFIIADTKTLVKDAIKFKKSRIKKSDIIFVLKRDGNVCAFCGATKDLTIDHIVPESKGGMNTPSNYQVLCRKCNSKKSNKI